MELYDYLEGLLPANMLMDVDRWENVWLKSGEVISMY